MSWFEKQIHLSPKNRGFHLITQEIEASLPELASYRIGLCHLFIQHTSASLTLNENCDPDVRHDMEAWANRAMPEDTDYFLHTLEGSDDMPAHLKSSVFGASLSIPVSHGRLALGTWQGIWLGEHRNRGGSRTVMVTIQGEKIL